MTRIRGSRNIPRSTGQLPLLSHELPHHKERKWERSQKKPERIQFSLLSKIISCIILMIFFGCEQTGLRSVNLFRREKWPVWAQNVLAIFRWYMTSSLCRTCAMVSFINGKNPLFKQSLTHYHPLLEGYFSWNSNIQQYILTVQNFLLSSITSSQV